MIYNLPKKNHSSFLTGFTLIELMIAITIISIMVSFGLSAYGKARDRQIGVAASEKIISLLQLNQSDALAGKKDCLGKYLGQQVTLVLPNTIRSVSLCEGNSGVETNSLIDNITFNSAATFVFNPLTKGIALENGDSSKTVTLDSTSGITYAIKLMSSGTIEYLGVQP